MHYYLKQYDMSLLQLLMEFNSSEPNISIEWINEEYKYLLPLDLIVSNEGLEKWLIRRVIPKNRAYVHDILFKSGLSINHPINIITTSKGLSLNDCYNLSLKRRRMLEEVIQNRVKRLIYNIK